MGKVGFVRNVLTHVEKKLFGAGTERYVAQLALALVCYFYLLRTFITWNNEAQALKAHKLWHFFILTRFVLVKYSRAFVERPSQGTSSLASQPTTVSLDMHQPAPSCFIASLAFNPCNWELLCNTDLRLLQKKAFSA